MDEGKKRRWLVIYLILLITIFIFSILILSSASYKPNQSQKDMIRTKCYNYEEVNKQLTNVTPDEKFKLITSNMKKGQYNCSLYKIENGLSEKKSKFRLNISSIQE